MKRFFSHAIWSVVAVLFLAETWLWDKAGGAITRIVRLLPIDRFKVWLEKLIYRLPPYGVMGIFIVPVLIVEPVKFVALDLIANGRFFSAACTFLVAKIVGLGIIASLFRLCRDKLLMIPWFRRLYEWLLGVELWAHAKIDPYRQRMRQTLAGMRERLKRRFGGTGKFTRHIAAIRAYKRRR